MQKLNLYSVNMEHKDNTASFSTLDKNCQYIILGIMKNNRVIALEYGTNHILYDIDRDRFILT